MDRDKNRNTDRFLYTQCRQTGDEREKERHEERKRETRGEKKRDKRWEKERQEGIKV